jgi:hypothetical protein
VRVLNVCNGVLIEGGGAGIASRLDAFDAERERTANQVKPPLAGQSGKGAAPAFLYDRKRTTGFEPAAFGLGSRRSTN